MNEYYLTHVHFNFLSLNKQIVYEINIKIYFNFFSSILPYIFTQVLLGVLNVTSEALSLDKFPYFKRVLFVQFP